MEVIVGNTGFVGSNIIQNKRFDLELNSKNVSTAFRTNPDLLVYCGVRAEKYLANLNPDKDFFHISDSIENIKNINPKKIVLISTIDVYDKLDDRNEDYIPDIEKLHPYGKNRLYLENWVKSNFKDYSIVRLPALFGKNLKKNFIFDLLNPIPLKLAENKFLELSEKNNFLLNIYEKDDSNFYLLNKKKFSDEQIISNLRLVNFSSLNFTDSRSIYQFYNLENLAKDLDLIQKNKIKVVNLFTEGLNTGEIYFRLRNKEFNNYLSNYIIYDLKTRYSTIFNCSGGYISKKDEVLNDIISFINKQNAYEI